LRVMSPTSYLAAPPRGGGAMLATCGPLVLEWREHGGGFPQGRGRRRRLQLDAAARGRRRGGSGGRAGAAEPGDAAGPWRRPDGPALDRGDRGGLRSDRRLRRHLPWA